MEFDQLTIFDSLSPTMRHSPPRPSQRRAAFALVLVLSILVLLTAVVVAFFISASTDLTNAKSFADEARVKFLADSAVNVVEGQIAAGTKGVDPSGSGAPLGWASQPGMIRTYDTSGSPVAAYKTVFFGPVGNHGSIQPDQRHDAERGNPPELEHPTLGFRGSQQSGADQ